MSESKLLEQLESLSKAVLVPTLVLYGLGFLCISSYLSRFGFQNFDILNARFIIAGIFPAISLLIAMALAADLYKVAPNKRFLTPNPAGWKGRYKALGLFASRFISYTIFTAQFLNPPAFLTSTASGRFSHSGWPINFFLIDSFITKHIQVVSGYTYFLDLFVRFLAYALSGWGLFWAIILIVRLFRMIRAKSAQASVDLANHALGVLAVEVAPLVSEKEVNVASGVVQLGFRNKLSNQFGVLLNILAGCCLLGLICWAFAELRERSVSLENVTELPLLTLTVYFAWMFTAVGSIFLFINHVVQVNQAEEATSIRLTMFTTYMALNPGHFIYNFAAPIVVSIYFFGVLVFPRIPFELGGGQIRPMTLQLKQPSIALSPTTKFYLVGESSQFLFVITADGRHRTAWQVSKDNILSFQTKTSTQ